MSAVIITIIGIALMIIGPYTLAVGITEKKIAKYISEQPSDTSLTKLASRIQNGMYQ